MEKLDKNDVNSWTEKRAFPRIAHHNDVKVYHPDIGESMMKLRDFSDSGVYLLGQVNGRPELEDLVEIQIQGLPVTAPKVPAKIVRIEKAGMAFQFC